MSDSNAEGVLGNINSLEELMALVGEITPEEREMLARIDFDAPPTEEELAVLDPEFAERVMRSVMARIKAQQKTS